MSYKEIAFIRPVNADEAYALLNTALERLFQVVEQLSPEDWYKPTMCTAWNVRDILAHQAGGYASAASYREFFRQTAAIIKPSDRLPEDVINDMQVGERKNKTPEELVAELRTVGPAGAKMWAYHFRWAKPLAIPHPVSGSLSMRHLMWVIHSRDTWMHRLDICRAAGLPFTQTPEHDGRIAELVMVDAAKALARKAPGISLGFSLSGPAGGMWKTGKGEPDATIRMDVLEFNIFASGRYSYEQARPLMEIQGNVAAAESALQKLLVLY